MKKAILLLFIIFSATSSRAQVKLKEITNSLEALILQKDFGKAKATIDSFYITLPKKLAELNMVEKYEVSRIEQRVIVFLNNEERAFIQIKNGAGLEVYQNYLQEYPFGKNLDQVLKMKTELEERTELNDFEKAKSSDSEEACRQYLSKYPTGKYASEVSNLLKERIELNLYRTAKIENTITAFENYINQYPNGRYSAEVNNIIGDAYLLYGDRFFEDEDYGNALEQYNNYLSRYPKGRHVFKVKEKIERCEREQIKSGSNFLGFYYDSDTPFGLYAGGIRAKKLSYYVNASFNLNYFTINNNDNIVNSRGLTTVKSGIPTPVVPANIDFGNLSVSNGLTFPIYYPFWGYVGGGFLHQVYLQEYDVYGADGNLIESVFLKNKEKTGTVWFPEMGVKAKIGNFGVLRYGIRYYNNQPIIHQFGIGFQIKQKN